MGKGYEIWQVEGKKRAWPRTERDLMILRVIFNAGNFLSGRETIGFPGRTLPYGVRSLLSEW